MDPKTGEILDYFGGVEDMRKKTLRATDETLFADDPLEFKKLIYEMRFDEVSAVYALFGVFYIGIRCPATQLAGVFNGFMQPL